MVGKIKHVRQKRHQDAVKLTVNLKPAAWETQGPPAAAAGGGGPPAAGGWGPPAAAAAGVWGVPGTPTTQDSHHEAIKENKQTLSSFPSGIFSGTKISREALVQTLTIEEPADVVTPLPAVKGVEEKKVKSKKEKMKERRERWLNKISSIKQAREEQVAEARRRTMPVVGDMKPLAEALPELSQLLSPSTPTASTSRRKNRKNKLPVKKKPEPTDFSLMKQPQKRKFIESESSRFGEAARSLASTANPLADIAEQLRKRMKQEEEGGGPS